MIFQIMDDKKECFAVFSKGIFYYDNFPKEMSHTWSYNEKLCQEDITYFYLWVQGQSLIDVCPDHLKNRLQISEKKIKAHFNSFRRSKVNIGDVCFYDLVPDKHLQHYYESKNEVCEWILENYEKPGNYRFLHDTYETIQDISSRELNINKHKLYRLSKTDNKARNLWRTFGEQKNIFVNYDLFGSVTGRLTTKQGSFPIMNLKTELKDIVRPTKDVFIELDFNAAEIRTLISLSGQEQPQEDIHEFNRKTIFGKGTREEAKTKFFAWLYNERSKTIQSDFYSRENILEKHYRQGSVRTPFGRKLECDRFHALNYLLQSTSSDNCMDRVNKINKFLIGTKSHVAFTIHDCVIIDLSFEDRYLIPQIKEVFEDTKLGKFVSSVHIGKDLGNMEELKC
mgnify:FL=1